jgi:hypothetical protein
MYHGVRQLHRIELDLTKWPTSSLLKLKAALDDAADNGGTSQERWQFTRLSVKVRGYLLSIPTKE